MAQVWASPALMASAVRPAPRSTGPAVAGDALSPTLSVLPYPSWPKLFCPPAAHGAVVEDRARVMAAGGHRSRCDPARGRGRLLGVGGRRTDAHHDQEQRQDHR
jgi:hypothetical protein